MGLKCFSEVHIAVRDANLIGKAVFPLSMTWKIRRSIVTLTCASSLLDHYNIIYIAKGHFCFLFQQNDYITYFWHYTYGGIGVLSRAHAFLLNSTGFIGEVLFV